jgi:hypothetical protein
MNDLPEMEVQLYAQGFRSNIDIESVEKRGNLLEKLGETGKNLAVVLGGCDEVRYGIKAKSGRAKHLQPV